MARELSDLDSIGALSLWHSLGAEVSLDDGFGEGFGFLYGGSSFDCDSEITAVGWVT
jgi:hypothetical protein